MKTFTLKRLITVCIVIIPLIFVASSSIKIKDVPVDTANVEIKDVQGSHIESTTDSIYFMDKDGKKIIKQMAKRTMTSKKEGDKYRVVENRVEAISEYKNIAVISEIERLMNYDPTATEIYEWTYRGEEHYRVQALNTEGKTMFVKQMKVYNQLILGYPDFMAGVSNDGGIIYTVSRDSAGLYNIFIYDSMGVQISTGVYSHWFEGHLNISNDGSIISGLSTNGNETVLFLMKTSTGEMKTIKQKIEYQGLYRHLQVYPNDKEKVGFFLREQSFKRSANIPFDSIVEDMSIFLSNY